MSLILIKLGISAFLGLVIGLERELKRKPVGLKTCLVISISSCLLTIVSIESAKSFSELTGRTMMDPMRLAAQVVSGIGFLGAGVILRRSNDVISGLTTAAMIWGASGLGIASGAGFYLEAAAGALMILISVELIPMIMKWMGPKTLREKEARVRIIVPDGWNMTEMVKEIKQKQLKILNVRVKDLDNGTSKMELTLSIYEKRYTTDIYYDIKEIKGVQNVEIETLS
ncbi:MgtC/SapB family protein [Fictibacillus sp. WQ 8-8]|uniref:MgtC/SapB family protein n=1 Tax=Fictibacillus marinisediminis TaxID=2878389 RepID=A0A9X1XBK5_9BACL|nr:MULTISPECIES: MgtC/SapB family protein [Fictibacillus]MCK6257176.1 MgtC/SapB family protein [Fictibacillus marinisediminis]MCQ6267216.1 MgtC/SapB family protein [Fictibacillus sp. WQ 8-8]MED2973135.1 MgtC/SapB family protein [Fictibacillus sp. B-59209]SFD91124.1 putative Mg2+ transporter-C (MgtC) family protein [Bacillus sp. OV194]